MMYCYILWRIIIPSCTGDRCEYSEKNNVDSHVEKQGEPRLSQKK